MFENLSQLISNPTFWILLVCYWTSSAVVGALPTPDKDSGKMYQFWFRFAHIFAGNLTRAALKFNVPGAQTIQQETADGQTAGK